MTPETTGLTFAEYVLRAGPLLAAAGVWWFGFAMDRSNKRRADTEKNRHEQIMAAFKDAAQARETAQAQADKNRKAAQEQAAEDRKAAQEQAAEDRKAIADQTTQAVAQAVGQAVGQAMAQAKAQAVPERGVMEEVLTAIQKMLGTLENQGKTLEKILRGNANPISKRGSPARSSPARPGSAE